ncbi:(2Fe-2S) ferredoxin domain-containing protein [Marinactinospora rubrisoli]|uniref:(2Fe-2S) ferredoxin domain-containing protein n=1 Tax=Marinactinospora rubrisoli TaxID=2715399 RepID=A0ABW2KHM1_9ACTN
MTSPGPPTRLVVCRGCCCGTRKKRPGVDHRGQLRRLQALRDPADRPVPVRVSKCLGICFQANVVVVQPSAAGRAAGARPVWLGEFTEDVLIDELDAWIAAGGPGVAAMPESLVPHVTSKDAKKPKKKKRKKIKKQQLKKAKKAKKLQKAERRAKGAGKRGRKHKA